MSDLLGKKAIPMPVIILLVTVVLAIVVVLIGAFSHDKSADDRSAPWQVAIDTLQQRVQSEQDSRQRLSEGLEGLRVSLHETMAKVDSQQAQQQMLEETLQAVRQLAVSAEQASAGHEGSLQTLHGQIAALEQRMREQMSSKTVTSVAAKPVSARPNAKPLPLAPPFRVVDVETRGGEPFLIIAPKNSVALSDMLFLREGDSVSGWQLARLLPERAVFAVGNRRHTVELQAVLSMN